MTGYLKLTLPPAILALSACSTTTISSEPPQEVTEPCMGLALASDIGWVEAHKQNVLAYIDCQTKYYTLIEAVRVEE